VIMIIYYTSIIS